MTLVSLLQSVPACTTGRPSTAGATADVRLRLHGGACDRVSGPRRVRDACASSRATRTSMHPCASRARRASMATSRPAWRWRGGSTQATEVDRAIAVAALLEVHPPEGDRAVAGAPRPAWPSDLPRDAARTGRPDHARRTGPPLLRPGGPGGCGHRPGLGCLDDDPEIAADLAEARADRVAWRTTRAGLGQRGDPRLRDRTAGRRARSRSGCPAAARRGGRRGGPRNGSSRSRPRR